MKLALVAALCAALVVPATAQAGPLLPYKQGRSAARQYVQENHVSYTTAAWLTGCWRGNRSRILCDYKSIEELDDGRMVCTGQVRAIRDRWLGVHVEERLQFIDCNWRYDPIY